MPDAYPYFLGRDWDLPNRAQRIEALLAATAVQTPQTSAAIQADTLSLMAQRLVPLMTQIAPADEAPSEAVDRLRHWDFRMDADKVEPLLFTAWLREFSHEILFGRFGDARVLATAARSAFLDSTSAFMPWNSFSEGARCSVRVRVASAE